MTGKAMMLPDRPQGNVVPEMAVTVLEPLRNANDVVSRMGSVLRLLSECGNHLTGATPEENFTELDTTLDTALQQAITLEKAALEELWGYSRSVLASLEVSRLDILEIDQVQSKFGDLVHYQTFRMCYEQFELSFTTGTGCVVLSGSVADRDGRVDRTMPCEVRLTANSVVRKLGTLTTAKALQG